LTSFKMPTMHLASFERNGLIRVLMKYPG